MKAQAVDVKNRQLIRINPKASGCSSYNSDGSCYGCRSGYVKVDGVCKKTEGNKGEKYNNSTACTNAGCKWSKHTCKC